MPCATKDELRKTRSSTTPAGFYRIALFVDFEHRAAVRAVPLFAAFGDFGQPDAREVEPFFFALWRGGSVSDLFKAGCDEGCVREKRQREEEGV